MAFSDITIYRDLPSINGYIQIPPNREDQKTSVTLDDAQTAIAGSNIVRLSQGSGRQRGSKTGQQEFLRLPGIHPNEWYTSDPLDDL